MHSAIEDHISRLRIVEGFFVGVETRVTKRRVCHGGTHDDGREPRRAGLHHATCVQVCGVEPTLGVRFWSVHVREMDVLRRYAGGG